MTGLINFNANLEARNKVTIALESPNLSPSRSSLNGVLFQLDEVARASKCERGLLECCHSFVDSWASSLWAPNTSYVTHLSSVTRFPEDTSNNSIY